jgi:hypothetical protein
MTTRSKKQKHSIMEFISNFNYDLWIHDVSGSHIYDIEWYDLIEERIGKIKRLDFVEEEWIEGQKQKALRVKFDYMYNNTYNEHMLIRIDLKGCGKFCFTRKIYGKEYEDSLPIYIARKGSYDFDEEGEKPGVVKRIIGYRTIYYTKNTKIEPLERWFINENQEKQYQLQNDNQVS